MTAAEAMPMTETQ